MTNDENRGPAADASADGQPFPYAPPSLQRLGTLEDLTLGGTVGPDDGLGGGGDGSL